MSETYKIVLSNSIYLYVDKNTNKIYFTQDEEKRGKYTQRYSKALLEADKILRNSPYKDYKPVYLDPELKTGQSSTLLEFKEWQSLYLKDPVKGAIAPWTKKEKAYYESLKTKRERYQYLVIRSGLRSAVIDIPYEAYCNIDEKGNLINKEYKELYAKVEANRGLAHLSDGYLFMGEWELAAGILGDIQGFKGALQSSKTGFKARVQATMFLLYQLGYKDFKILSDTYEYRGLVDGIHQNMLKAQMIKDFAKNPPYDKFGMLPYLDELIGVDWVLDLNMLYGYSLDERGNTIRTLYQDVKQGKLKDPRDVDSTPESRREFLEGIRNWKVERYDLDLPSDWSEEVVRLYIYSLILVSKIKALTPPQGYPNAPTYYIPEDLEELYKENKLDKRLNPTIPAMYRANFPEDLRKKIEAYAKEHNI